MEFDQSYNHNNNGTPLDWSFPSPTATPTTGSFGNTFHTPKATAYPTHFQDAFNTPQFPSYSTPQQAQYASMTPMQRPPSSSETLRSNYYAYIQSATGQHAPSNMPPPGVSPTYGNTQSASMQLAMNTSFDSSHMQTPPPTRGASNKRPQHGQQVAFGTPSTIASRRFMTTPQQPIVPSNNGTESEQNPVHFPQLAFSPDMYQFANMGPASAPVVPQSRMLWGSSTSPMQPTQQASLDDPFAPVPSNDGGWSSSGMQQNNTHSISWDTPAMNSFPTQPPQPRPASAVGMSTNHSMSASNGGSAGGVDPSLLYSSPANPVLRSNSRAKKARSQATANEGSVKDTGAATHTRTSTASSTDTVQATSTLQRPHTTGPVRPKSANFSTTSVDPPSRSDSFNQVPRTASPVKRFARPSLGSISEGKARQRASVILTVDENGRARTETKRVDDSPTRSIRERYPALFDSDSSDAESETSDRTPSRPASFMSDKREGRKSKIAKLDSPVENLEGLSIPRSGSSMSMRKSVPQSRAAVAAAAQLRRQNSARKSTSSRNQARKSVMSHSNSATSLIDTYPMDVSTTQQQTTNDGDYDGSMNWSFHNDGFDVPTSNAESTLDAHNRRWSIMSHEQHHNGQSVSPSQQYSSDGFQTQPQQHAGQRQLLIRCVCGVPQDTGIPMIQCQSCTQWLHAQCLGYDGLYLPSNYTCFLCTRPPTNVLHGNATASAR